ncbi:hypothetical protein BKA70DRAFT_1428365 [Coprinopsis sp. MPI-PUGE-AT-0042]|nr:hypothetical protein BKA70DRAFT_1428365 [Coprinopsis sp. MPI-PUGE-AT-0042]
MSAELGHWVPSTGILHTAALAINSSILCFRQQPRFYGQTSCGLPNAILRETFHAYILGLSISALLREIWSYATHERPGLAYTLSLEWLTKQAQAYPIPRARTPLTATSLGGPTVMAHPIAAGGLPDDILREIFFICTFDRSAPYPCSKHPRIVVDYNYHLTYSVVLGHVCSAWRTPIVQHAPTFWARICPIFKMRVGAACTCTPDGLDVEMLELWLQSALRIYFFP